MKKNKISIVLITFLILTITLFFIPTNTYARYVEGADTRPSTSSGTSESGVIDPGNFKPDSPNQSDVKPVVDKANVIIGAIKVVGVAVTMIVLMVLGIKYMTGSVSEKAEYKKTMIPYLIGALIFFGLTQFLGIIIKVAQEV